MKIYNIVTRQFLVINIIFFISLYTSRAQHPNRNVTVIKNSIQDGVNISLYEHYWSRSADLLKVDIDTKIKNIVQSGFKTVRIPISFEIFLQPNSINLQPELLIKLKNIYQSCAANNLNLIISYFYGELNDNYTQSDIDRISWMWKQIQRSFANKGYSNIYFELFNEPVLDNSKWKPFITTLIQYLRYEDSSRVYIVGGTNYNSLEALELLGRLPDNKILYTFHFYEPYIFTHQGATWNNNKTNITGIPYPYQKNKMPALTPHFKGDTIESNFNKYPGEANAVYISKKITAITDYCKKNDMPLICTETGVITLADEASRENYLTDVTKALSNHSIPAVLWDYDQKFSIKKDNTKILGCLTRWLKKNYN